MNKKGFLTGVIVTLVFCTTFWLAETTSSQVTVKPNAVRMASMPSDTEKRLSALEADNFKLKKDVAGLKLLLSGLDKGVTTLKNNYEKHTHKLAVPSMSYSNFQVAEKNGFANTLPYLTADQYKANGGFMTGGPIQK
ncbi:MAG: hypothetical protein R2682_00290 [Pyrinomonadaceae bacterium]